MIHSANVDIAFHSLPLVCFCDYFPIEGCGCMWHLRRLIDERFSIGVLWSIDKQFKALRKMQWEGDEYMAFHSNGTRRPCMTNAGVMRNQAHQPAMIHSQLGTVCLHLLYGFTVHLTKIPLLHERYFLVRIYGSNVQQSIVPQCRNTNLAGSVGNLGSPASCLPLLSLSTSTELS